MTGRPKRSLMSARRAGFLVICVLVIGVVEMEGACLAAVTSESSRIEKTAIVSWERPVGQSVQIYARGGYCAGEPPPTIHAVRIREHRLSGRARFAAVVTVFLKRLRAFEASSEEQRSGEAPAEPVPVCAGVEHALYRRIRLHRPASEVVLFDGSQSPPRRIPEAR